MAIPIDQLAAEVNRQLELYAGATLDNVKKTVDEVGKDTVRELRETSPKGKTGDYANAWTISTPTRGKYRYQRIINAGDEYRLTHLLEKGHNVKNRKDGPVIGWAKPKPRAGHIKPAEERMIQRYEEELRRRIEAET